LVTDFMNLKTKPTQSFRCIYRDRVCVLRVSAHMYISIYIYIVFLKNISGEETRTPTTQSDLRKQTVVRST
jgi:hypothetical protein